MSCQVAVAGFILFNGSVVSADNLRLGGEDSLVIDYADSSSITDLNNGDLQLKGDTLLSLLNAGAGDGKTYTLMIGVSGLVDAEEYAIKLDDTNNAASLYFDTTQPGTGFWAAGRLVLVDGNLQIENHNEDIIVSTAEDGVTRITTRQTRANYQYHKGVNFEKLVASHSDGGAVAGIVTLSHNGRVSFIENMSMSTYSTSDIQGGAILGPYNNSMTLTHNGSVEFHSNSAINMTSSPYASARGGAVFVYDFSDITLNNNGNVIFSDNAAFSESSIASGGAVCGSNGNRISLSNNGSVSFFGNTVSSGSSSSSSASGGAIYLFDSGRIILDYNGSVNFSANMVCSAYFSAYGGAICSSLHGDISLSHNATVNFSENIASSTTSLSYTSVEGGAIYGGADITLSNNDSVIFCGNKVISACISAHGGAIWVSGNLSICNNHSVKFYQNAEVSNGSYRLRSIYGGGHGDVFSISSAKEGCIEFLDSIYIVEGSIVNLNNSCGELQQTGDIIFTGATTVDDLYEVKGKVYGTDEEVLASRTTEVNTLTNLYGGRLRVEDGAIYQGQGIMVHEGSAATVLVKDATLNHDGFALTFNAGTTLQVEGESLIVGDVLMLAQSVFNLDGETTINGALALGLGMQLAGNVLTEVQNLQVGQSITLVSGLESLAVQTQSLMRSVEYTTVMDGYEVQASEYFSNLAGNTGLVLRYDGEAGTVSISQTQAVPEPATATLSLLALAALAAHRRRK